MKRKGILIISTLLIFACALPPMAIKTPVPATQTTSTAFYKHTRDLVRHEAVRVLDAVNVRCFEACE